MQQLLDWEIQKIQENILSRYQKYGRNLPWRKTKDPYAIHVSEVMLQQTQVERVIPYFLKWIKKWPDYSSFAKSSRSELLGYWSGLGFNSRALRLRESAQIIEKYWLPVDRKSWMQLPGVGPYTSSAILSFAYNEDVPVIDTNIRRVLIFLFKLDESLLDKDLERFAEKLIPKGKSRDRHNALMDYGAIELTANKTGIRSKSKQSKFEGSDRQVRGWIVKYLLKHKKLSLVQIQENFPQKSL